VNCAINKVSFSAHTGGVVHNPTQPNPTRNTLFDACWYNVQNCLLIKITFNKSKYFTYAVAVRGFCNGIDQLGKLKLRMVLSIMYFVLN
jgi:hypothetical protein